MRPAVETEGLTKLYGRKFFRRAAGVVDLDLTVRSGEVFGYLGPNGAGKSTTLRCLVDLLHPTRGRARVLGLDSRRESVEIRRRVGYLPGELCLDRRLTGRQLLRWFENLRRAPAAVSTEILAERLDLDLSRQVRSLSKGNRQKLGIVQALMHRPELLLLDEPTSGLDPLVREEFFELVREGRARGQTFLLSSHRMDEVQALADRVGILRDGRLVAVDTIDDLLSRALCTYAIRFAHEPPMSAFRGLPGVRLAAREGRAFRFEVEGGAEALMLVAGRFGIERVESSSADLGRVFLSYYDGAEARVDAA